MLNPNPQHCNCIDCPGSRCNCGCQAEAAAPAIAAPAACSCGPNCCCEGAEQGCLCSRRSA